VGSGFKTFTAGSVLTASDVQNYLQDQAVMVFGGTAARSSAIGTANFEEGMLTYLTDVDKLQVYTGSSFQDVYPPAATSQGMTLINTTSFSGVASISVNDVFSSTYRVYRILLNVSSGSGSLSIRLRASGADNTSSVYNNAAYFWRSGGAGGDLATDENVNQAYLVDAISNGTFTSMDLYNPNVNSETNGNFTGNHISGSVGYITMSHWGSIRHNTSYQATGFTYIFGSTGTGTVHVYGYNQ
jgi:hypothetical protein